MEWLMKNYNVEKFGDPTWQRLVEAVGHPAGGANMAVARRIARRHKAGSMSSTWLCLQFTLYTGCRPEMVNYVGLLLQYHE